MSKCWLDRRGGCVRTGSSAEFFFVCFEVDGTLTRMPVTQARNWCFTLHDWSDAEMQRIVTADSLVRYVFVGEEKCPSSGRPHLQGYVQLAEKCSFTKIKKHWGVDRLHLEVCRGSAAENLNYCGKEGATHEAGTVKAGGARGSFRIAHAMVVAGASMAEIMQEAGESYQVARGAELAMKYCEPGQERKPEVYWIWGPQGSGKGKKLLELIDGDMYTDNHIYCKMDGNKFWNYDRQRIIVIKAGKDTEKLPLRALFSHCKYAVETKGASRQIVAKEIYVLTEDAPPEWLRRKIEHIITTLPRLPKQGNQRSGGNTNPRPGSRWEASIKVNTVL